MSEAWLVVPKDGKKEKVPATLSVLCNMRLLLALLITASLPLILARWDQFGGNERRTFSNDDETEISPANVMHLESIAHFQAGDAATAFAASRGFVYISSTNASNGGLVTVIDGETGAVAWEHVLPGPSKSLALDSTSGTVFATMCEATTSAMLAISSSSNSVVWSTPFSPPCTSPVSLSPSSSLAFFPTTTGIAAFPFVSCASNITSQDPICAPSFTLAPGSFAPSAYNNTLYVAVSGSDSDPASLLAYDLTGNLLWRGELRARYIGSQLITISATNNMVYVSAQDDTTVPSTGFLHAFSASGCSKATCDPIWWSPITSGQTALADGSIYLSSLDGTYLYAYNETRCLKKRGECIPNWISGFLETASRVPMHIVVANGLIFGANGRRLMAVTTRDARPVWCHQIDCEEVDDKDSDQATELLIDDGLLIASVPACKQVYVFAIVNSTQHHSNSCTRNTHAAFIGLMFAAGITACIVIGVLLEVWRRCRNTDYQAVVE